MTYNTDKRKALTPKQRAEFLLSHDCKCYWCGEPIIGDEWDDEHVIAKELMAPGSDWNALSNRRPIHRRPCHKEKTAMDRKAIAKSNRIRRKHGLDPDNRKPRPKMQGRGFPKQSRPIQGRPFPKRTKSSHER